LKILKDYYLLIFLPEYDYLLLLFVKLIFCLLIVANVANLLNVSCYLKSIYFSLFLGVIDLLLLFLKESNFFAKLIFTVGTVIS
jgi:hypothetical protein